jgi:hypothetical protein
MPRAGQEGVLGAVGGAGNTFSRLTRKGSTSPMDWILLVLAIVLSIAFSLGLGAGLLTLLLRLLQSHSG